MSTYHLPSGVTEPDLLAAIQRVGDVLARQFAGGPHDADDIRSLVGLYSVEALTEGRFDPARPLGPYLYTNTSNRLLNMRRSQQTRRDHPCARCHAGDYCRGTEPCPRYQSWWARNRAKANLFSLFSLDQEKEGRPCGGTEVDVEVGEVMEVIDRRLPVELRRDFLRLRAGEVVPQPHRGRVEEAVLDILRGIGLDPAELGLVTGHIGWGGRRPAGTKAVEQEDEDDHDLPAG